MININGKTKLFGVLADPIDHVKAPEIYNERWLNRKKNFLMVPIHVKPRNLSFVIEGLRSISNFFGFCVTLPHKVEVAKLCNHLNPNAEMIGAVNVAYFNKKRELIGDNFDGEGFVAGLIGEGYSIENKNFFIYGAGGAARSISFALAKYKASSLTLSNRTFNNAKKLSDLVHKWFPNLIINLSNNCSNCDVIINTSSVGLNEKDKISIDIKNASEDALITDIIMQPEMTKLLKRAKLQKHCIHLGKHMLSYQSDLMENILTKQIL
ncbi:MAG: shikimate dehydrogenase [SAR116 cluster bacterium]|nr:shikimate dehydrogenase [SAR116 cluster bacterium]